MSRASTSPQNSVSTVAKKRVMPVGRRFVKGQSGNPGGRPKGVRAAIQALIGENGEDALKLIWQLGSATDAEIKQRFGSKYGPRHEARLSAVFDLLDRAFGKPTPSQETTAPQTVHFTLTFDRPAGDRGRPVLDIPALTNGNGHHGSHA